MSLDDAASPPPVDIDIISLDPMWETQVELERGMTREGANRVQEATTKAMEKGRRTTLKPYQELLQAWIPKVADDLRQWVKLNGTGRKGGPMPVALDAITEVNPYTAALIGLREILDGTTSRHTEVTSLAIHIGRAVEHELQVCLWEKSLPKHFHDKRRELKQQKADHTHTERVNIHVFNKLLASGTFESGWERWDQFKHVHVGNVVLNAIVRATGWFETFVGAPEGTHKQDQYILQIKPGMETWITDRLNKLEECSPSYKPTVVPPKRWTGMHDGGYWTPYVRRAELIPLRAVNIQQKEGARQEFDAIDMPQVYSALHFLQETPWRVNKAIYDAMEEALRRHLAIGDIPEFRARELPPKPIDMDTNEEVAKAWRREASHTRGTNALMVSKQSLFSRTMLVAHQYKDFERFYFPHSLDFRGRMYPIPTGLQPQGHDFARGLLQFAEGKVVKAENQGDAWLAINLASAWGNDKISFDDRVKWVHENNAKWKRIAKDPIKTHALWAGVADKPWQALAAILDWVGFLKAGFGYVSHAAVAVDGTCNGLQHLSALGRDPIVGKRVNLVPGDKPNDVYQFVADALRDTLRRIVAARGDSSETSEPGEHAEYWLGFGVGEDCKLPRSLTKRPVMILAYSATKESFFKYTKEWLDEHDAPKPGEDVDWSLRYKRIGFLVTHLWDAVHHTVPRAMRIMKWLQECAACAAEGNQPIFWRTPDGFIVRHFYGKMRSFKVCVKLDDSRVELRLEEPTKNLDKVKQLRGIAPNYVHSLDGTAARACINKAAAGGAITAFASVHDSFGTHAANMWTLYGCLREAFVELHEADVLMGYRNMCLRVMVDWRVSKGVDILDATAEAEEMLPEVPEVGDLDIRRVLESDYFFA